jgi:hypothetical protein
VGWRGGFGFLRGCLFRRLSPAAEAGLILYGDIDSTAILDQGNYSHINNLRRSICFFARSMRTGSRAENRKAHDSKDFTKWGEGYPGQFDLESDRTQTRRPAAGRLQQKSEQIWRSTLRVPTQSRSNGIH